MAIQSIQKITKNDIERLNKQNAIFKSKSDIENGNSTNINTAYFGDNGDIYLDNEGRIFERQNDGSEVYMGWADQSKLKKEQPRINSAYDYFDKFPDQNNNELVNGRLNKVEGNTFNNNSNKIKSINQTSQPKHTEFFNGPIEVDRSALDNKAKHTEFFNGPIEVDRTALDNKAKHTEFFNGPIEVDRSALDKTTNSTKTTSNNIASIQYEKAKQKDNIDTTAPKVNNDTIIENTTVEDKYTVLAKDTLSRINEIRRENGLPDLQWSEELSQAAAVRAEEASQLWSHTRPNGQPYNSVNDEVMGENLAKNYPDAESTVEAWMNSDSHRAILLDKEFKTVGISVVETEDGQKYYAADFGEK